MIKTRTNPTHTDQKKPYGSTPDGIQVASDFVKTDNEYLSGWARQQSEWTSKPERAKERGTWEKSTLQDAICKIHFAIANCELSMIPGCLPGKAQRKCWDSPTWKVYTKTYYFHHENLSATCRTWPSPDHRVGYQNIHLRKVFYINNRNQIQWLGVTFPSENKTCNMNSAPVPHLTGIAAHVICHCLGVRVGVKHTPTTHGGCAGGDRRHSCGSSDTTQQVQHPRNIAWKVRLQCQCHANLLQIRVFAGSCPGSDAGGPTAP